MEQGPIDKLCEMLLAARDFAAREIHDGRERAIVVRHLEDAFCRLVAAGGMPPLPSPANAVRSSTP